MIYVEVICDLYEVSAGYVSIAETMPDGKFLLQDTYVMEENGYGSPESALPDEVQRISRTKYLNRRVLNNLTKSQKNARRRLQAQARKAAQ